MHEATPIRVAASKAKTMRSLTFGLLTTLALGSISAAQAADLDYGVLRGPDYEPSVQVIDWSGFYFGAHGGYSSAALGFTNVFQPLVAKALRATTVENELNASQLLAPRSIRIDGVTYGAFLGYNIQFDDIVVGVEADYSRFDAAGIASDQIGRSKITADGTFYQVNLLGTSSTRIVDYGTLRGRAGYALGSLLPYVTGGVAIGRAQIADNVLISTYSYNTQDPRSPTHKLATRCGLKRV